MAGSGVKGAEKRRLRDEVAALAGQVAGLRAELAAAHAAQHCHGSHQCYALVPHPHCNWGHCWCYAAHSYSVGPAQSPYQPVQVWCGTVTSGGTTTYPDGSGSGYLVTNGYNSTLSLS